jgi:Na+/melibiose symporter-like transporter
MDGDLVASPWWRAAAAGASAMAGVLSAVIVNEFTDEKSWAWGVALTVSTILLVVLQVVVTAASRERHIGTYAQGALAAGGSVDADVDIDAAGPAKRSHGRQQIPTEGVVAGGQGSVASGKKIKGKIKIKTREH